jgi:hypothetical protein
MPTQAPQHASRERDTLPEIHHEPAAIRVRDVVRNVLHDLPPAQRMLRVPYDLFMPVGSVLLHDGMITYEQGGQLQTGSTVASELGDSHPAERVLLRLHDGAAHEDEWWLCEVQYPAR